MKSSAAREVEVIHLALEDNASDHGQAASLMIFPKGALAL